MRKIILNTTYDEAVRTTVLTALDEIENREKEVLRAKLETETIKGLLQSNALELQNILNANELSRKRGDPIYMIYIYRIPPFLELPPFNLLVRN